MTVGFRFEILEFSIGSSVRVILLMERFVMREVIVSSLRLASSSDLSCKTWLGRRARRIRIATNGFWRYSRNVFLIAMLSSISRKHW